MEQGGKVDKTRPRTEREGAQASSDQATRTRCEGRRARREKEGRERQNDIAKQQMLNRENEPRLKHIEQTPQATAKEMLDMMRLAPWDTKDATLWWLELPTPRQVEALTNALAHALRRKFNRGGTTRTTRDYTTPRKHVQAAPLKTGIS